MTFEDADVLVTGAASGIGEAIAERFLEKDANVIAFDVEEPELDVEYHKVDVRDYGEVEEAISNVDELDILVNNAGVYEQRMMENITEEHVDATVDTNLKGYLFVTHHALPLLKENEGTIVNISSGLGERAEPGSPVYTATKYAINGLTESMAQHYNQEYGIRVNAVLPGPVETPMLSDSFDSREEMEEYGELNPSSMIGSPADVARVVTEIADPSNEFVNGAKWEVDGGESVSTLYTNL